MSKVYIVLTHTGTLLSKIIKFFEKDEFSHVSLSLDNQLKEMYSFGRLNPKNPFIGGFVHESINHGTFKRFKYTRTKIYSLDVTEEQYITMKNQINYIKQNRNNYKFNIIGLFAVGINKKIKLKNAFYCAEFVKYILETSGVEVELPDMIKPEDFKNFENAKEIYNGKLKDYNVEKLKLIDKIKNSIRKEALV